MLLFLLAQLFLGQSNKVYIVDKTENNPVKVNGHPAWATEYDLVSNTFRTMDIKTNSFCAGGNVLGNGTWINVGGNQPVTYGGLNGAALSAPYDNADGGKAMRYVCPALPPVFPLLPSSSSSVLLLSLVGRGVVLLALYLFWRNRCSRIIFRVGTPVPSAIVLANVCLLHCHCSGRSTCALTSRAIGPTTPPIISRRVDGIPRWRRSRMVPLLLYVLLWCYTL